VTLTVTRFARLKRGRYCLTATPDGGKGVRATFRVKR
jgi:hypothetical protein